MIFFAINKYMLDNVFILGDLLNNNKLGPPKLSNINMENAYQIRTPSWNAGRSGFKSRLRYYFSQ